MTKRGSDLTIDLSDSHEQVAGFVNSSYPNMCSAVVVALAYLIDPHTPKNDGAFRPLEVIAKPGTVVWANEGAPVTLCTNHCAQEIIEAIIKALAPACPDRAMAGWGRRFRIAIQGARSAHATKPFIWHMFQARPGGGASPAGDGWPGAGEWQAAGGIKFGSLEVTEVRFPLFFRTHEFRPDSGGDGQYRGGPGGVLEMVGGDRRAGASATPPATACATAPAASSAARTGCRTATCCTPDGRQQRALKTKEVGIEIRPGDVFDARVGRRRRLGRSRQSAIRRRRTNDVENGFMSSDNGTLTHRALRAGSPPPAMREGAQGGDRSRPLSARGTRCPQARGG